MPVTKEFPCTTLFTIPTPPGSGNCGVAFLDLDIKVVSGCAKAPTLYGPGIYCLCFRSSIEDETGGEHKREDEAEWKLIYIGSFLGTDLNIFSGNAAARRWWTLLASITMRGNSVSIGRRVLRQLVNHYPMDPIVGALQVSSINGIANAGGKTIHDDQGCVSSRNRTKFAIAFQHCFHGVMLPSSKRRAEKRSAFRHLWLPRHRAYPDGS